MSAVCDTSPLLLLAKVGRLDLLMQLYREIIVPASVLNEIKAKPDEAARQVQAMVQCQQFQLRQAAVQRVNALPAGLGAGEREAMALAAEIEADLVILDDQQGRRIAREKGFSVTGTVGVLIEARSRSLVASVRYELDRLIEAGLWIDEVFYHRIMQEFEE